MSTVVRLLYWLNRINVFLDPASRVNLINDKARLR